MWPGVNAPSRSNATGRPFGLDLLARGFAAPFRVDEQRLGAALDYVGGNDDLVIDLNQRARAVMRADVQLEIVPGATHLFEEPGALEQVAELARAWFVDHLSTTTTARSQIPRR